MGQNPSPLEPGESGGWGGREGEKKRGDELVGSRHWAPGEHMGFSPIEDGEGGRGWRAPCLRCGLAQRAGRFPRTPPEERESGGSQSG